MSVHDRRLFQPIAAARPIEPPRIGSAIAGAVTIFAVFLAILTWVLWP